jgi:hypothetical protein
MPGLSGFSLERPSLDPVPPGLTPCSNLAVNIANFTCTNVSTFSLHLERPMKALTVRPKNLRIAVTGTPPGLITLEDHAQLYLAPGAVVYGGLLGKPENAKVFGRGIPDGIKLSSSMVQRSSSNPDEFLYPRDRR